MAQTGSEISTNVRATMEEEALRMPAPLRLAFRTAGRLAPAVASLGAEALFFRPPRHQPRESERRALAGARRLSFTSAGETLPMWSFGEGPAIALVHGWGGRGGQLRSFIPALVARGFRVVTWDMPGHAASSPRFSTLPRFADALLAAEGVAGPFAGVVAHSLGGAATAIALSKGLGARAVVLVGSAAEPRKYFDSFLAALDLPASLRARIPGALEQKHGFSWDALSVPTLARGFTAKALVVHDTSDLEVPVAHGRVIAAAWPGGELLETEGLGHRKVLHAPEVVNHAAAFLESAVRPPRRPVFAGERERLEAELFDPAFRLESAFPA